MNYISAINKIAKELNIPKEVVSLAYRSYWKFIRQTIQSLPLKEDISEEEFAKLRTNFNIPSLGKLTCTFSSMMGAKKRLDILKSYKQ
jgi:hypothetical protein